MQNKILNNEEQLRLQEFIETISQADKRYLEELLGKKAERSAGLESQIDIGDRKIIQRKITRSSRYCNLTQAAHLLKVHRQTIYYWLKKSWIKSKRDYRGYPVFTVLDIECIIKWRNSLKKESFSTL
jgi:transcriptional regulator with PAS, ATPase and Fis domain